MCSYHEGSVSTKKSIAMISQAEQQGHRGVEAWLYSKQRILDAVWWRWRCDLDKIKSQFNKVHRLNKNSLRQLSLGCLDDFEA